MARLVILVFLFLCSWVHANPISPVFIVDIAEDGSKIQTNDGVVWLIPTGLFGLLDARKTIKSWERGDEVTLDFYCCGDDTPQACFRLKNLRTGQNASIFTCLPGNFISAHHIQQINCKKGFFFTDTSICLEDGSEWEVSLGASYACSWEKGDAILIYTPTQQTSDRHCIFINPSHYLRHCRGFFGQDIFYSCAYAELCRHKF